MRKRFAVIFAVVVLLNTMLFAVEAADNGEKDTLASFLVKPEFTNDIITINFSEIQAESNLDFSFNPETGFISAVDENYSIFVKELDENIEVTEEALLIKRVEEIDLYLQYRFKAYVYICSQETGLEGTEASLAIVTVDFADGRAYFIIQKIGTSSSFVNNGNVDEILEDNLILVNKEHALNRSYFPQDMIYSKLTRGRAAVDVRLNKAAVKQLNYMLEAAYRDGISGMVITSAFRNYDKQTSLYNNKINTLSRSMSRRNALEEASKVVAVPGSSEHQTGLAVDICSEGIGLISKFSNTRQGKWLKDNSWKYGYVVRYPEDKTRITGIIYEPWHFRYVGSEHAELMNLKGMSMEEYVDYLKENRVITFSDSTGDSYAVQYITKQEFSEVGLKVSLPESSKWSISNCTEDSYILTIKL